MVLRRGLAAAIVVVAVSTATAQAQTARTTGVPAETPPDSHTGDQYVDSRGCVFVRARFNGSTTWVPRVSRDRQPVCGETPSLFRPPSDIVPVVAPATRPVPSAARTPGAAPAPTVVSAQSGRLAPDAAAPETETRTTAAAAPRTRATAPASAARATGTVPSPVADRRRTDLPPVPSGGYKPAFTDGRLNPHRGPRTAEGEAQTDRIWTREVPRRLIRDPATAVAAPAAAATAKGTVAAGYVQVGVYRQAETVGRAVTRLQRLGLPSRTALVRQNGRRVTVVLAGPFRTEDQVGRALASTRANGFPDAVPRR